MVGDSEGPGQTQWKKPAKGGGAKARRCHHWISSCQKAKAPFVEKVTKNEEGIFWQASNQLLSQALQPFFFFCSKKTKS